MAFFTTGWWADQRALEPRYRFGHGLTILVGLIFLTLGVSAKDPLTIGAGVTYVASARLAVWGAAPERDGILSVLVFLSGVGLFFGAGVLVDQGSVW
ncbi:hypothetical protein [Actinocorallia longicatena]|uniref:Uncharacterized protein n=1 Tax=Actinocorallia longicatena TaxID=111803 RepID=A0ABP6QBU2_9ACTN